MQKSLNHFNVHNQRHYKIGSVSEILVEYQLSGLCSGMVWVAVKEKFGLRYFILDKKKPTLKRNNRFCSQNTTSLPDPKDLITFYFILKFWTKYRFISVSSSRFIVTIRKCSGKEDTSNLEVL